MSGPRARGNILKRLREAAPGFVSGESLGTELGISRPAVWKHVSRLRSDGYQIEAVPRRGYRLVSSPDLLVPQEIQSRLRTSVIGAKIRHFDVVGSTNEVARDLALKGAPEGTIVIAEKQSAGRGRLGRPWVSPAGGIYFSVVLHPALPPTELVRVTLCTAVSVARAIRETAEVAVAIKWPNDILCRGRKLVGILTEMVAEADSVGFAVVGIGINANTAVTDYPAPSRLSLTTLASVLGRATDRTDLLVAVLEALDRDYARLKQGRFAEILDEWKQMCSTIGTNVRVSTVEGTFEGIATGVNADGSLVVTASSGEKRAFRSGEVEHLRSA